MAPKFHKASYRAIADILKEIKKEISPETHKKITRKFISLFESDNGLFDEDRFLIAVGYQDRI